MRYDIDWNGGDRALLKKNGPRASNVWVLRGYVVAASTAFKGDIGMPWPGIMERCKRNGMSIQGVASEAVPPTVKYHRELLACVTGLLDSLCGKDWPGPACPVPSSDVVRCMGESGR